MKKKQSLSADGVFLVLPRPLHGVVVSCRKLPCCGRRSRLHLNIHVMMTHQNKPSDWLAVQPSRAVSRKNRSSFYPKRHDGKPLYRSALGVNDGSYISNFFLFVAQFTVTALMCKHAYRPTFLSHVVPVIAPHMSLTLDVADVGRRVGVWTVTLYSRLSSGPSSRA